MNWYRIKTVLIFLFIAINLFLATLLLTEHYKNVQAEKARIAAAKVLLSQNGSSVSAAVPHSSMRLGTLTLENPKADPQGFARRVLGGNPARLGESYRREGRVLFLPENGFMYDSGEEGVPAEKKHIRAVKEAFGEMGFSTAYIRGYIADGCVVLYQEVDGVPLFDYRIRITPTAGGRIAKMEGTWAEITEARREPWRIGSAADALLSFLQEGKKGEIVSVQCGYAVFVDGQGYRTADAIPVWRLETAGGEAHVYDAR